MKVKQLVEMLQKENPENDIVINAIFTRKQNGAPLRNCDDPELGYDEDSLELIDKVEVGESNKQAYMRNAKANEKITVIEAWNDKGIS